MGVNISKKELYDWLKQSDKSLKSFYKSNPERQPSYHNSNVDAMNALKVGKKLKIDQKIREKEALGQKPNATDYTLSLGEIAEVIMKNIATVTMETPDGEVLAIYDYDRKIYTYKLDTILNDAVVQLSGSSSLNMLNNISLTMRGMKQYTAVENPLPPYKVAVGNGIYNCITGELEPFTPEYTVLTKIDTNYVDKPDAPVYNDGFTLEHMIEGFANHNPHRIRLIKQICKAIITGHAPQDAIFIIIGEGGDGKSTFFTMLANILGGKNTSYLNFSELSSDDKMVTTLNKKLAIGMDNDDKVFIQKTSLIKTIASKEPMSFSRKYQTAIAAPFLASFVQLVNTFPRFAGGGHAIGRRLVTFKAEHSHTMNNTANPNVDSVYIKDPKFLEYALWYFLNEETTPYYNKFNTVDSMVTDEALHSDDLVAQFVHILAELKVLGSKNKQIPTAHLYLAFRGYVKRNSPSTPIMSSRTFTRDVEGKLRQYGYALKGKDYVSRTRLLENKGLYDSNSWDDMLDYPELKEELEKNTMSRVFERVQDNVQPIVVDKPEMEIDPIKYFKMDVELKRELGVSQGEELTIDDQELSKELVQSVTQDEQHDTEEDTLDTTDVDIYTWGQDVKKVKIQSMSQDNAPPDKATIKQITDTFDAYKAWLYYLRDNKDTNEAQYDMLLSEVHSELKQIGVTLGDMQIYQTINLNIHRNRDVFDLLIEALDYIYHDYIEPLKTEKKRE